jgi:hypothetical protein
VFHLFLVYGLLNGAFRGFLCLQMQQALMTMMTFTPNAAAATHSARPQQLQQRTRQQRVQQSGGS